MSVCVKQEGDDRGHGVGGGSGHEAYEMLPITEAVVIDNVLELFLCAVTHSIPGQGVKQVW